MQDYQGRFIQDGLMIDHTPGSEVAAGEVIVQNNVVGVAKRLIEANALGALAISGVFDVVKAQEAFATVGANIFWDETGDPYNGTIGDGAATATAVGNTWMGYVLETADATDETVRILLRSTVSLTAEEFSLADLSDIDAVDYTAGDVLVADGAKYADVPLTGPFSLAASGLLSVKAATVAGAGTVQADAALIAEGLTLATGADATVGVKLPAAAAGACCIIKNEDSANAVLKVYPADSDKINALAANASLDMAAKTSCILIAYDAEVWYTIPLLPS